MLSCPWPAYKRSTIDFVQNAKPSAKFYSGMNEKFVVHFTERKTKKNGIPFIAWRRIGNMTMKTFRDERAALPLEAQSPKKNYNIRRVGIVIFKKGKKRRTANK